ncbi:MAG: hypothetical protein E2P02_04765 [Acidobacteria bacterium]|nr:MAG: hypothetical protein E2P02_04765 [Acidobacteriota bacterium]
MKIVSVLCVLVFLLAPSFALAHPHFSKTVTAKLPSGAEATITYGTTPANLSRAESAEVGVFVAPRGPKLMLSAAASSGGTEIPAGEYTIGVIKNSADDWTMALYTGGLARGETPDEAKIIKLDSMYSSDSGTAEHMLIDITPGHGKFEGKAVLTLHFGNMLLAGAIS